MTFELVKIDYTTKPVLIFIFGSENVEQYQQVLSDKVRISLSTGYVYDWNSALCCLHKAGSHCFVDNSLQILRSTEYDLLSLLTHCVTYRAVT